MNGRNKVEALDGHQVNNAQRRFVGRAGALVELREACEGRRLESET
jgi:hypothetical protein